MSNCGENERQAQELVNQLEVFVEELLVELDRWLDKRLVETFQRTLQAILMFRHSLQGLLLSELGGYILSPAQAPAGTKRLSNLLRSRKWSGQIIEAFLWRRAKAATQGQERVYIGWDESVVEKAESLKAEGLCAVRSSQAARLKRIKPGFYNPPGGRPIFVPGLHWISVLVLGSDGQAPMLAAMRWWTSRGPYASHKRKELVKLLKRCVRAWKQRAVHIFDRGFAGRRWLKRLLRWRVRFILRWPKRYKLVNAKGEVVNAWKVTRGKRSQDFRELWDARRQQPRRTGIVFAQVHHPDFDAPLWLVVSRPGSGREPWYLLTSEPIASTEDAWRIVFAYARRWQIEMAYRYAKSELAMESPRLWFWHNRLKLMLMVSLVYAFLLSLLSPATQSLRDWLLRHWCHRTGKRYRSFAIPLYRLRSAISRLFLAYPASPPFAWKSPG
jgi:hypothetical protein